MGVAAAILATDRPGSASFPQRGLDRVGCGASSLGQCLGEQVESGVEELPGQAGPGPAPPVLAR